MSQMSNENDALPRLLEELEIPAGRRELTEHNLLWLDRNIGITPKDPEKAQIARGLVRQRLKKFMRLPDMGAY